MSIGDRLLIWNLLWSFFHVPYLVSWRWGQKGKCRQLKVVLAVTRLRAQRGNTRYPAAIGPRSICQVKEGATKDHARS